MRRQCVMIGESGEASWRHRRCGSRCATLASPNNLCNAAGPSYHAVRARMRPDRWIVWYVKYYVGHLRRLSSETPEGRPEPQKVTNQLSYSPIT